MKSDANEDDLSSDEIKFRQILSHINMNRKNLITTTGYELQDHFGEDIFQLTRRLEEKGFLEYNKRKQCYYIKDAGIDALNTIYNPEWIKQNKVKKKELEQIEERRHKEILEEQRKANRNQWIGIVIAGIIGLAGLLIAISK